MWFSALKLGLNAASHIYKKRQETKMAMADAQHMHAAKMAKGETEYQGKLLEARQSDWKDEAVLVILTLPILVIAWGVFSDDPGASEKIKMFFVKNPRTMKKCMCWHFENALRASPAVTRLTVYCRLSVSG